MQAHILHTGKSIQFHVSSYGGAAELRGDVVAWLACLTLSLHQSPQDGAGGDCTSSSNAVTQASTLLHHGKLKRGMWRLMRGLRDLGTAHTFHTAVPHTSAWPHPNARLGRQRGLQGPTVSDKSIEALYSSWMHFEEFRERSYGAIPGPSRSRSAGATFGSAGYHWDRQAWGSSPECKQRV